MRTNRLCRTAVVLCCMVTSAAAQDYTQYVNPFIGTGAVENSLSGNNYPGATYPFGMVQLSPDTRDVPDWGEASGYNYNDSTLYGFSHTRLSGTGVCDLLDLLFLPVAQERTVAHFSHDNEQASPGYYSVWLHEDSIRVELTATRRAGLHRYTYYKGGEASVFIDLNHSASKGSWGRQIQESQMRLVDSCTVAGYRIITGWAPLRKVYFYARFSCPIRATQFFNGDRVYRNAPLSNGTNLRALLSFGRRKQVECRVALSPVSIENARLNLQAEVGNSTFDSVRQQTSQEWNRHLALLPIEAPREVMVKFYTALYHTMIQPNTLSDVNGEYMDADYTVRRLGRGEVQYSTFSLWDTYRAAHPLYTLIEPALAASFVNSMMRQYRYYGYLPIWQLWGQENYCMIGNHAVPVVVDALLKGLPGIDAQEAYRAVKQSLTISHLNSPFEVWDQYGYMPEDLQSQSVSITLEASFDDWCAAQLASRLGHPSDSLFFARRSTFYRNLFNPATRFFQPKDSKGEWMLPFDPYQYGANGGRPFTEGNAWQYYWYVPHDVKGLIALTGGNRSFCAKLDEFFTSTRTSGETNGNASGFVGLYAHGNEPSHHVPYLYALAGEPWKTQQLVHHIKSALYNTSSSGYAGNDDCGEMSAWYIFSALGFYPVNPASGEYVMGTPSIDHARIGGAQGKVFEIRVTRESATSIYVKKIILNGKKIENNLLPHSEIVKGGLLQFVLCDKPGGKVLKLNDK